MLPALFVVVVLLAGPRVASGQVVAAASSGGLSVSAGGMVSGYALQYGDRKMGGVAAFVDLDSSRHWGLEGEARWLVFNQKQDVHVSTYLGGPRIFLHAGRRFQPYVKILGGAGLFNFPYNDAHGTYTVVTPGGGLDYELNPRIRLRLADFEYQYWPNFTYGSLSSGGISSGIRIRLF